MLEIAHAGFFVAAEQRPHRVAQRKPRIPQVFQRVQAEDARPLVIHDAAAEKKAVALPHREGILGPAVSGGNHIDVGDGGKIALPVILADGGIADLVLAVDRVQPEFLCNLQGAVKGTLGFNAEGRVRRGRTLDARNADKAGDVADDVALMGFREAADVGKSVFIDGDGVHGEPPYVSKNRIAG